VLSRNARVDLPVVPHDGVPRKAYRRARAIVNTFLFIPYSLCDWRLLAWRAPHREAGEVRATIARSSVLALKVQVSIVYLVACVSKLATGAWMEGSALYCWTRIPAFGTPNWLEGLVFATTGNPVISVLLTWGTLLLEFALGVSLLLPLRFKLNVLLPAGFLLHGAISVRDGDRKLLHRDVRGAADPAHSG
jgi:antimicrobial peptide system SdpB family protein